MTDNYLIDIGLEAHVELSTCTKMFCGCAVVEPTLAQPNSAVCPVCMGLPGALPVINRKAVEFALRAALALGCQVNQASIFARKNYFYPDLPKGYQISQYEQPLAVNGMLPIQSAGEARSIRIRRAHLEEDTGKLTHVNEEGQSYSLVDLNRSGVPLLEIVSEPDLHSLEDVQAYAYGLRTLLRYLAITSGDMEKGAMRFEANLSLRPAGSEILGTRVEIKNLNSFRAMQRAMAYQIEAQKAALQAGQMVQQQTLGWSEGSGETLAQRSKEEAHDYRYFPEPDLPPLLIEKEWIKQIADHLPELPFTRARRFQNQYHLAPQDIDRLIEEKSIADYFEQCLAVDPALPPREVANWISGALFAWVNEKHEDFSAMPVTPANLVELLQLLGEKKINLSTAKDVLAKMLASGQSASALIDQKGLRQESDEGLIQNLVQSVLSAHPQEVQSYLNGKETLANWFFGLVMASAKGQADPVVVKRAITRALQKLKS